MATRAATVQLPLGQLAVVGLGVLCVANPEKFFRSITIGAQLLQNQAPSSGNQGPAQPIIIHHGGPSESGGNSKAGFVVKLVLGAGLCWGSYAVLVAVLPESASEHLPVSRKVFNQAVTSLGRAVISLKDTLMEQINLLSEKQVELGDKQDKTHSEVLDIKDHVQDVRGDLSSVQEALDLCQASLTESERRTSYIARGVQLLTRGVSTILPEDEYLLNELARFNIAGEEFRGPAPLEERQRRLNSIRRDITSQVATAPQLPQDTEHEDATADSTGYPSVVSSIGSPIRGHPAGDDPENEVPSKNFTTPASVEKSVAGVHTLLRLHSSGAPRRSYV